MKKQRKPNQKFTERDGKLSEKKEFYVYALLDTRKPGDFRYGKWKFNCEPFYIGKGKGNRSVSHIKNLRAKDTTIKSRKIKNIIKETGQFPLIVIKKQKLTEKQALDLEILLIKKIGRINKKLGPLANLTDGGEGHTGHIQSRTTVDKRKATIENKTQEEKDEILKRISASLNGRSEKDKEKSNQKRRDAWNRKTQEEKDAIQKKIKATRKLNNSAASASHKMKMTWENKTQEEKDEISKKLSEAQLSRTKEQKIDRANKVAITRSNWSDDRKNKYQSKQSAASKNVWSNRSEKEKEEFSKRVSKGVKAQHKRLGHKVK